MTITKKIVVSLHALRRFRERIDPFVSEQTVIKAVGRSHMLQPGSQDFRALVTKPEPEQYYFFEPQRNLLFITKRDADLLVVKTVLRPDARVPVLGNSGLRSASSMSMQMLIDEKKATLKRLDGAVKGSAERVQLGKRLSEVQQELHKRRVDKNAKGF